jgi:hypothetical protein
VGELQFSRADPVQQIVGDGMAHPGDDAFGAGDGGQLGDEPFDAHVRWCVRFEDLLEVAGDHAACALAAARYLPIVGDRRPCARNLDQQRMQATPLGIT